MWSQILFKFQWHPAISCEENARKFGGRNDSMMLFDNDLIKCCPMCAVPIEKDEGCAQMMCKRCKHVFCWYCLASLDVSVYFVTIWSVFRDSNANYSPRMTSCCDITTKALAKTSWVIRVHLSFGIERKSSAFLRALEFCCSLHRHYCCSVIYATFPVCWVILLCCFFFVLSRSVHCLLQMQNRRNNIDINEAR